MKLNDQVVLITGGANGIGRYLSERLSTTAAKVLVIDKDMQALNELKSNHGEIETYHCDLLDYEILSRRIDEIYAKYSVSILVNNAGYIHSEPVINLMSVENRRHNIETWNKTLALNLNSTFYAGTCVIDNMVSKRIKGLLVNVSSISAHGNIGQSAYSAAKAGINALTKTWSKELGMFGIRCAAIAPGFIDTISTRQAMSENQLKQWQKQIPLNRLGELEEVFGALKFLIENDYYNGRILELDGGLKI